MINLEEDKLESLANVNDAKSLSAQCVKLQATETDLKAAEEQVKKLKKEVDHLSGEVIPTMMQEMNLATLKLADGSAVEVKPVYGASIPVAKKEEAFNWLRSNGLGDLIKNEVPVQKLKVEPMTLKALVRERIEAGQDMPSDLFNVFAGNRTKITRK